MRFYILTAIILSISVLAITTARLVASRDKAGVTLLGACIDEKCSIQPGKTRLDEVKALVNANSALIVDLSMQGVPGNELLCWKVGHQDAVDNCVESDNTLDANPVVSAFHYFFPDTVSMQLGDVIDQLGNPVGYNHCSDFADIYFRDNIRIYVVPKNLAETGYGDYWSFTPDLKVAYIDYLGPNYVKTSMNVWQGFTDIQGCTGPN